MYSAPCSHCEIISALKTTTCWHTVAPLIAVMEQTITKLCQFCWFSSSNASVNIISCWGNWQKLISALYKILVDKTVSFECACVYKLMIAVMRYMRPKTVLWLYHVWVGAGRLLQSKPRHMLLLETNKLKTLVFSGAPVSPYRSISCIGASRRNFTHPLNDRFTRQNKE
jgi:hypothetical protein